MRKTCIRPLNLWAHITHSYRSGGTFYLCRKEHFTYVGRHLRNHFQYYRPPELLMGVRNYGPEVDMWSVGCILVELLTRRIAFQASSLPQQLRMMNSLLGSPNPRELVGCNSAIDFVLSQPKCESTLPALLQSSDSGLRKWF